MAPFSILKLIYIMPLRTLLNILPMRFKYMGANEMIGLIVVALGSILSVGVIIVKPILQVVKTMTELNVSIKELTDKFNKFEVNNHDDHKRIWRHNDEQDERIQDHETRIRLIENGN